MRAEVTVNPRWRHPVPEPEQHACACPWDSTPFQLTGPAPPGGPSVLCWRAQTRPLHSLIRKIRGFFYFFNFIYYLFLVGLGARLFPPCGNWGFFSSCSVRASCCSGFSCWGAQFWSTRTLALVAHGLSSCSSWGLEQRLNSCGAWAWLPDGMWDLPRSGIEPCLLRWHVDSLPLNHQGSPKVFWLAQTTQQEDAYWSLAGKGQ